MNIKVCILRTDGTNCDNELYYAFEKAGAKPELVHINQLRNKSISLHDYNILAIPGGFSYGDDIASGKILALELISYFKKDIKKFVNDKKIILGICNGFQVLVRTGLLPFNDIGSIDAALTDNASGRFECRWVKIKSKKSKASYLNDLGVLRVAVNHGEGNFDISSKNLNVITNNNQIIFEYVDSKESPTNNYPDNPNGSLKAIAGICDPSGRIIGLMPHPEKYVTKNQHPNWRKLDNKHTYGDGLNFFRK